ncbi:MAG TPA: hypothetical protein VGO11_07045 [Chthoniobacteraceae bacterium]|jgi:hypothetical protein|nr:hypothetical protein [Chthoniobacteraceae bacterium]
MIPQAIASSGVYADLWSHLKSMDHALLRVSRASNMKQIAELDKSRLKSLGEFLRHELDGKEAAEDVSFQAFLSHRPADFGYSLDVDLRLVLAELPSFKQWLRTQRLGFRDKAAKLIAAVDGYSAKIDESLFPSSVPQDEFAILHELLCKVLSQTESALVS